MYKEKLCGLWRSALLLDVHIGTEYIHPPTGLNLHPPTYWIDRLWTVHTRRRHQLLPAPSLLGWGVPAYLYK